MFYTNCTVTISGENSIIDKPVILYRGDKEVEIKFYVMKNKFYQNVVTKTTNIVSDIDASFSQLVIRIPEGRPIFSEVTPVEDDGAIVFKFTAEMIDEITEVGSYDFQIRLLDQDKTSRATIPPVVGGIKIKEPIAMEDEPTNNSNEVNVAQVNEAIITTATPLPAFDEQGNYIETTWTDKDLITDAKLNKIEDGITGVNQKADSIATLIPTKTSQLTNDSDFATNADVDGKIANMTDQTILEPEELDIPKVFFNGDKPTTKDSVNATIEYISRTEHFKAYVDIKCQGTSSMSYPKKNYTIKMFSDEAKITKLKKDFRDWGKQSKFCLKANYIDHSHARNIVSAKLWGQVVKSRSDFDTLPEELKTSPNYGAVDGFPIKVYYNNTYEGVYTWNIPKDGWMNNMDDTLDTHCILCGEEYDSGCFRSANASLWSDELHDTMPANIVTSFNNFQSFVINSSDDEFKTGLSTYADINSLIDYYIFQYVVCGLDSMGKNQLFFTYDGIKWIASSYDMDSTFGMYWNGQSFVSAEYRMQEDYESMANGRPGNLLYIRMEELFCNEIKARYAELRAGVLSYANIVNEFERFMDVIGKDLYAEDLTIYTGIPSGNTNNIQQIRNYTRDRLVYVDTQIEALAPAIPCTGIVLSTDTLSFTTTDTQTLSVVVSPDNCTDAVTWSVSPSGIVTVDNGVVIPVTNGNATITVTCGSYSDTCAVTVNMLTVECTGITLDKNTLALGDVASGSEKVNLLSGVNSNITSGNVVFDAITLEAGIYEISNINEGTFTWLGYTIDGTKKEPHENSTENVIFIIESTTDVIISAYPDNKETNTVDKLALYKYALGTPQQFTQAGEGYFDKSSGNIIASNNDVYSETISLDTAKQYILVYNGSSTLPYAYLCMKLGNTVTTNGASLTSGQIVQNIKNTSTIAVSINTSSASLSDIQLIEMKEVEETSLITSARLIATVTPDNCTQPVVWSVSPEGIATVVDGLVTAIANGEAVVTATCGSQTATCNVSVTGYK